MEHSDDKRWTLLARPSVEAVWREHGAWLASHGIELETLLSQAIHRTRSRLARHDRQDDELAFREAMRRAALADLGLVLAWQRGSEAAWAHYSKHYREIVMRAARQQGADPGTAEELADELPGTLLGATHEGGGPLARYDGSGSLAAWLTTIARRRASDRMRGRGRNEDLAELHAPVVEASQDEQLVADEELDQVRKAAQDLRRELTPRERVAFLLKHEQGLSGRAIARQLAVSDSRVTRLVQQALDKIRSGLAAHSGAHAVVDVAAVDRALPSVLLEALSGENTPPSDPSSDDLEAP